jgi:uroporphyrinogen-III synthase
MTEELRGRRIVVPETRELDQLVRLLEERGAEAIPGPMIAIRDAPDAEPITAWLRRFADGRCDDLVLMTGEGLRRLLGFARRTDLESAFLDALRTTRKITRGPKPVRALRAVGLDADIPADEPTTEGIIAAMRRLDLSGRSVGVQLNPGNPNPRLMDFIVTAGAVQDPVLPYIYTCSFRKFHPAWIRIVRQNHRIIASDVCDPVRARNVRRRPVQVAVSA